MFWKFFEGKIKKNAYFIYDDTVKWTRIEISEEERTTTSV